MEVLKPPRDPGAGRPRFVRWRGRLSVTAGYTALLLVSVSPPLSAAVVQDWPSLQGGPEHAGSVSGAPAPPLKRAWRSGPPGDARLSSPAVVPGLAVATGKTRVVGLDPSTGEFLWTVPRIEGPLGTPAIDLTAGSHGVIVFTEGGQPAKSAAAALDLSTRQRIWTTPLSDVVTGSPTIDAGTVFLGARDRSVYAIDALSGEVRWKRVTSGSVNSSLAVAAGRVFVTSLDATTGSGRLSALDVATGSSRWTYSPNRGALGISSPTVGGNRVFVGFNDQAVRAFAVSDGRLLWSEAVRASFSPLSTLAVSGGSVFAVDDLGGVYRFDERTGHRSWDYQFPANVTFGSPLVADDRLYVGMDDGTLAALDVPNGHLVWSSGLSLAPVGAWAPSGDLLLVSAIGQRGGIIALAHDPDGTLIDEPSPTELKLPVALANFAGAFLVTAALLLGVFGVLGRRRREHGMEGVEGDAPAPLEEEDEP